MSELFYRAAVLIQNHQSFNEWEYQHKYNNSIVTIDDLGIVELVEIERPDDDVIREAYYGDYPQGYEGKIALVFKVTSPKDSQIVYVRKEGTVNSYGSESWDGPLTEVKPVEKPVVVFERV